MRSYSDHETQPFLGEVMEVVEALVYYIIIIIVDTTNLGSNAPNC